MTHATQLEYTHAQIHTSTHTHTMQLVDTQTCTHMRERESTERARERERESTELESIEEEGATVWHVCAMCWCHNVHVSCAVCHVLWACAVAMCHVLCRVVCHVPLCVVCRVLCGCAQRMRVGMRRRTIVPEQKLRCKMLLLQVASCKEEERLTPFNSITNSLSLSLSVHACSISPCACGISP